MVYSVMLHKANQVQSQKLNVLQKYKLVKILISSHPFNKIYLQAKKNAVRCFSAILDKQWFMQLYSQAKTDFHDWHHYCCRNLRQQCQCLLFFYWLYSHTSGLAATQLLKYHLSCYVALPMVQKRKISTQSGMATQGNCTRFFPGTHQWQCLVHMHYLRCYSNKKGA